MKIKKVITDNKTYKMWTLNKFLVINFICSFSVELDHVQSFWFLCPLVEFLRFGRPI